MVPYSNFQALEYTVYLKFGEFDANGISKNTYRRPRMNLEFLVFHCDEHFNIDTSDDGSKWPTPDLYIKDHPEKAYFGRRRFSVSSSSCVENLAIKLFIGGNSYRAGRAFHYNDKSDVGLN